MGLIEKGPFTTAPGPRRQWGHLTIWAEDGLIMLENPEPAPDEREMTVMTCSEARSRLRDWAVKERDLEDRLRTNANGPERGWRNDAFFKLKRMVEIVEETLDEAFNQGDQDDPEVAFKKQAAFIRAKAAGKFDPRSRIPSPAEFLAGMRAQNERNKQFSRR